MNESAWPVELPRSGRDAVSLARTGLDLGVFREYDIRGRTSASAPAAGELNEFAVNRIGRAFGTALAERGIDRVVIGYDSRSYSESLAQAMIVGMLSTGRSVTSIGLATTPMVYFAQHELGGLAGVSVTASHNPNGWTGLKLSFTPSTTLGPPEIAEVRDIAAARTFHTGAGNYTEHSVTGRYTEFLAAAQPAPRALKVVVDGGNSVSGPIAERVLASAGYDVVAINRELDWSFPNHEPDPENMAARAQLQDAVIEHAADCGVSFDGDGDRLGVTDGDGGIVFSDVVLSILARDVLARHPRSTIIYDVKCSRAVAEVISGNGGRPVMGMTGHSLIKAKMQEESAAFAGERSGHFFNAADYFGFDDAIHAALSFLRVVASGTQSVAGIVRELPQYVGTPTMHAECPDEQKYAVIEQFAGYAESLGADEVVRINGVRVEFDDGWLLVRASSNEPSLVLVVEAKTDHRLRELYDLLRKGLADNPAVSATWRNDPFDGR